MGFKIIFETFLKWRKVFYIFFILSTVTVLIVSFFIPRKYIISTTLMPYQIEARGQTLPSEYLRLLENIPISFGSYITPSDILASLAQKGEVIVPMIIKLNLIDTFKAKDIEEAVKKFNDHYEVRVAEDGMVNITFVYKHPETGVKVLNEILNNLENFVKKIHNQFYEKRESLMREKFIAIENELKAVEDTFKTTKLKYGVHSIEEEFKSVFPRYTELKKEEIEAEIEYKTILSVIKDTNDIEVKRAKKKYFELKKEIEKIEKGENKKGFGAGFGLSLKSVPEVSVKLMRLWRKIEALSEVYQTLLNELEKTKIEASKDIPFFSIVSKPGYSKYNRKPKRIIVLLGGLSLSLFFGILLIYFLEFSDRIRNDERLKFIGEFFDTIASDLKIKK
ncbi:MAG: GNVR domain-containing protein [candidate division WOR-3 bacterium]